MERTELDRRRQNAETFARATEQIRDAAVRHEVNPSPFICECSATNCMTILRLTLDAYREVRDSGGFMVCPCRRLPSSASALLHKCFHPEADAGSRRSRSKAPPPRSVSSAGQLSLECATEPREHFAPAQLLSERDDSGLVVDRDKLDA